MSEVPYSLEERSDTGFYNSKLGLWLILAALIMFFGALYSSYVFLRIAAEFWPGGATVLPFGLPALAVLAIALHGGTVARAWTTVKTDPTRSPTPFLAGSMAGAVVFVLLLLAQWRLVQSSGAVAATSNFYGLYFLFLALHMVLGVAALMALVHAAWQNWRVETHAEAKANRIECAGLLAQFNVLLWLVTFTLFHVF